MPVKKLDVLLLMLAKEVVGSFHPLLFTRNK